MKVRARARTARRGGAASLRLPFGLVRSPSGSKKARGAGASASAAGQTHADGVGGRRDVEARRDVVERGAAGVYVEHLMRMNRLLARAVRGAQDTNRELVAMGSRILALHEAGEREPAAARVDLASSLTAAAQAWAPQTPSYSPVANGGMQHAGGTVYYCTTTQEESERGATDASESDTAPALVSPTAMEDTVGNTVGDSAGEAAGVARLAQPAPPAGDRHAGQAASTAGGGSGIGSWRAGAAGAEEAARSVARATLMGGGPAAVCLLVSMMPRALLAEAAQHQGGRQKSVVVDCEAWGRHFEQDIAAAWGTPVIVARLCELRRTVQRAVDGASARLVYAAFRREAKRLQADAQSGGSVEARVVESGPRARVRDSTAGRQPHDGEGAVQETAAGENRSFYMTELRRPPQVATVVAEQDVTEVTITAVAAPVETPAAKRRRRRQRRGRAYLPRGRGAVERPGSV